MYKVKYDFYHAGIYILYITFGSLKKKKKVVFLGLVWTQEYTRN